uniref:Uncharacterized protein n=1 Tax=Xiphophorus maculatus TaxID=8083 RepID=A0A3B5R6E8_XIPMA
MIQNRVTLTSNIEDVLEENQEHLGRSEEDSASISSQKAAKAEKYYLSDTVDYLNNKDSEEVQENGLHLLPNSVISRTTVLADGTNKWEKQEVKLDQTDAKLKTKDPVKDKEKETVAVISPFEGKRDTKEEYMELSAKQEVKEEGITETPLQKTKETGSHKEIYNLTLPLATLFTHSEIQGTQSQNLPVLKRLYLDRNQLQSVPTDLPTISGSLPPGALSPLHNLRTLNLDYNQLASVPLELPLSIKELYLRGNHLEQLSRGVFNGISQIRLVQVHLEHNFIDMGKLDVRAFRCLRGMQVVHFY